MAPAVGGAPAGGEAGAEESSGEAGDGSGGSSSGMGGMSGMGMGGMGGKPIFAGMPNVAGMPNTAGMAMGGGMNQPDMCAEPSNLVSLEWAFLQYFTPFGYYETSATELITLAGCPDRPNGAVGVCQGFEWTPQDRNWVGLEWIPDPSRTVRRCIETGVTKVSFQARGEFGGEVASFGVIGTGLDLSNVVLSDTWQRYEIDLTGIDYNHYPDANGVVTPGVLRGFSLVLGFENPERRRVFVDDIQWLGPVHECAPPRSLPDVCVAAPEPEPTPTDWCEGVPAGDPPPRLLMDDFQDGDSWSAPLPGGRGFWSSFDDGSRGASQYPGSCSLPTFDELAPSGRDWSLQTYGCGFQRWGAGMQLNLRAAPPDCFDAFDASDYDGVEFLVRAGFQGHPAPTVVINTSSSIPVEDGGSCLDNCYRGWEFTLSPAWSQSPGEWSRQRVRFVDLRQGGAPQKLLKLDELMSIGFMIKGYTGMLANFDYAIDEVALFRE